MWHDNNKLLLKEAAFVFQKEADFVFQLFCSVLILSHITDHTLLSGRIVIIVRYASLLVCRWSITR